MAHDPRPPWTPAPVVVVLAIHIADGHRLAWAECRAQVAVAVARDVRAAAGLLPTQVVVAQTGRLPIGEGLSRRLIG